MKAATCNEKTDLNAHIFQSTPPVKAATAHVLLTMPRRIISIHAAREGGDDFQQREGFIGLRISIHAAREGGDLFSIFAFTGSDISIHAAREGGDPTAQPRYSERWISIHAAREGGDHLRAKCTTTG